MLPCSNPFNNSPGQVIEKVETVSECKKEAQRQFKERMGVASNI